MYSRAYKSQRHVSDNDKQQSEDTLVRAATNGDSAAFEILMCRYRNLILALTRRLTDTPHDAEHLTQHAVMKAYINLSRCEQKSSFSPWVAVIARNEALMWRRKAASNRMVPIVDSNSD